MKRGTTNPHLATLIVELKKSKEPVWKEIAEKLEGSTRRRASVSLRKIDLHTKAGDTVVIPGAVLSQGELKHKVTIAALSFSAPALKKIHGKGEAMKISQLFEKNPDGARVRIMV